MGAFWLRQQLEGREDIISAVADSDRLLKLVLWTRTKGRRTGQTSLIVYCPSRDEYEVNQAVADRAAQAGASAIVGDMWTRIATGTIKTTGGQTLRTYTPGAFLQSIR